MTGVGVVSPLGIGREPFWRSVADGLPPFRDSDKRAHVSQFDAARIISKKGLRYLGNGTRYVAAAAVLALEDANLRSGGRLGFVLGTAFGNNSETFNYTHRFLTEGVSGVSPMASFDSALNSQANYGAVLVGAQRFNKTICGLSASLEAITDGAMMIRAGRAQAALAGGMDYLSIDFERWSSFDGSDDRRRVSEGAYLLVLEDAEFAASRGALALAEVGASGMGFDTGAHGGDLARRVFAEAAGGEAVDLVVACEGADVPPPWEVSSPGLEPGGRLSRCAGSARCRAGDSRPAHGIEPVVPRKSRPAAGRRLRFRAGGDLRCARAFERERAGAGRRLIPTDDREDIAAEDGRSAWDVTGTGGRRWTARRAPRAGRSWHGPCRPENDARAGALERCSKGGAYDPM